MDLLQLIKPEDLVSFAENYNYKVSGFMGQKLFAPEKTRNIKVAVANLVDGGDLPVMAQVHALDSEARIGERPKFQEVNYEKLLIKEKLDQGERVAYYLDSLGGSEKGIVDFVFNDAANLLSRVIARTEVANMELLSTGKLVINENNAKVTIDYGMPASNKVNKSGWGTASHDILGDLKSIQDLAKSKGWKVVRAITSSKIINYMMNNTAIQAFWANKIVPLTEKGLLEFINEYYGIEFVINDDVYKFNANAATTKRFFNEDVICFLGSREALGKGFYGVTPEELKLRKSDVVGRNLCTLTMWEEVDPATTWTKASGLYLPMPKDINKMIIATIAQ